MEYFYLQPSSCSIILKDLRKLETPLRDAKLKSHLYVYKLLARSLVAMPLETASCMSGLALQMEVVPGLEKCGLAMCAAS